VNRQEHHDEGNRHAEELPEDRVGAEKPVTSCHLTWLKLLIVKSCELLTSGFGAGIGGSGALS
jgi:hypothetical protein